MVLPLPCRPSPLNPHLALARFRVEIVSSDLNLRTNVHVYGFANTLLVIFAYVRYVFFVGLLWSFRKESSFLAFKCTRNSSTRNYKFKSLAMCVKGRVCFLLCLCFCS